MKKLLAIIIVLLSCELHAQLIGIGANMVNIDQYADSLSMVWYVDMTPEGSVIPARLRTDKAQSTVLDQATIDKGKMFYRIALQQGRIPEICYTVNLWASGAVNLSGISQLINYGCNVPYAEIGNEYYSEIKKTYGSIQWTPYQTIITPVVATIRAAYPMMRMIYPACPSPKGSGIKPERQDHANWNNALRDYLNTQPAGDGWVWHVYYDSYDASVLSQAEAGLTKQAYNPQVFNTYLNSFYQPYFEGCYNSTLWDKVFAYTATEFGARTGHFTEYGTVGSGNIRDTWTYAALVFRDGVVNRSRCERLYIHSGISLTGVIQPKNAKYDPTDITTTNVRRVEYWAMYMANRTPRVAVQLDVFNTVVEGDNYFWYVNVGLDFSPVFNVPNGYEIDNTENTYIKGSQYYSTGGATAWQGTGTVRSQEIAGVTDGELDYVRAQTFGYIKIHLKKSFVPVLGCTDPTALNYNPLANTDDGSCYYFSDCRCGDITATNYDPDAPCVNNALCEYPPQVCYKKRIFFSGCKVDKNCKVDNCKQ